MKRLFYTLLILVATTTAIAQVPREKVVVEVATGTWCPYCPGAAMGVHDLIENGWPVVAIKNHYGDSFANQYSNARNLYYSISGYPTAIFDGQSRVAVGSHNESMYESYYPKVQARMNVPSPLTIEVWGSHIFLLYSITVRLEAVTEINEDNIRLHVVLTESNIPYYWQGMTECDYVNRLMVPDQNGTVVDLNSNPILEVPLIFSLEPEWVLNNLELAVFVQNNLTREILQGYKVRLAFLMPPPPPLVAGFSSNISNVCAGGAVQFEDLSTGNPDEWFWEFPGGTPDTSWEQNPLIVYDVPGKYDVSLTIIKAEDTNYVVMEDYITVSEIPTVSFDPIDYQCLNYPAFELTQGYPEGGTYSGPGVEDNMFDPFLAGIGEHTLLYTYADTNDCENSAEQSVIVDACTGIPEQEANITALPNPTKGTFQLTFSGIRNSISYKVMNSAGIVIEEKTDLNVDGGLSTIIDLSGYPNGIHYVLIENNGETYFRKVILNK